MAALSELFDKLLYVLADMDVFGRSNSPSMFIVYAHDSEDGGSSGAQYAKRIIKWLLALRSRILSDKSPLRSKREGGIAAARNILSNQFCLLPPGRSTDGSGDEITSVDKVILCGSEVLQRYYGHAFTASYINGIQELYDQAQHRSMLRESLQHEIREFVERQCQSEGFHHVLTELAFLALRRNSCGRDDDGIIPMRLSGDEVSYLPFITKCDLFLKVDDSPSMAGQHKLFFNLLRQLYADPSSHAIVDAFQDCYENVSKHLQGEVAITREAFRRIAYKEIFKAQTTVLHSRTADIRDEEWRQQWKAQTESSQ